MKRALSILSAVLFLLCAVPFTASVSAATSASNLLVGGGFEEYYLYDWDFYQNSGPSYDAAHHGYGGAHLQGNGGWGALMEQTISVNLGKAYHLEFWYKVIDNGFNWRLEQSDEIGLYETRWETATEWTFVSYDFVASSPWVTLNFCGSGNGMAEQVFVDDVVICPAVTSDFDGYIVNGDFERGDDSGWSSFQYTYVGSDAAFFGDYGAHLRGNGDWDALLEQSFPTVPGEEYAVMFFYKVNQNGFNAQIKTGAGDGALAAQWLTATEWELAVLTFVADWDYATLNLCGGGNGIPEDAYVDEVYVIAADDGLSDDLTEDGEENWITYGYAEWTEEAAWDGGVGIHLSGDGDGMPLLERTVATVEGAEHSLSFAYQANAGGFYLDVLDGVSYETLYTGWYEESEWTMEEATFIATSDTIVLAIYGEETGVAEDVYLDEIYLTAYEEEFAPAQEIKNGDFEHNQFLGWSVYQDTHLSTFAAASGEQGAFLQGDGGWGALLEQGFFTEPGVEYALTFQYKVMSNGFNLQVMDGRQGDRLAGGWYTATEWTEETVTFVAASETTRLNFCGSGNGIYETAFVDDVVLTCLGESEPEYPEYPDDPEYPELPDIEIGELVAGETQEVTVSEDIGMSFFLFTPVESGWYSFTSAGDSDTHILITDENGESALSNDNDADGHNFRAVTYCVADTPYLLMLTTTEFSGTFDVTVDAVEPDEMFPGASSIAYGDTAEVELEQTGVSRVFSFVPEESGTYILTSYGEEDTYCILYDVEGTILQTFDDEFTEEENYNFAAAYDCVAGNTYYFLVSSYAEGAVSFTVELTAEEEPPTPPDEPLILLGDADGNGEVNNRDLGLLQRYLNGWEIVVDEDACDVDGNGEVNNRDMGLLQRYTNGWDVELG